MFTESEGNSARSAERDHRAYSRLSISMDILVKAQRATTAHSIHTLSV